MKFSALATLVGATSAAGMCTWTTTLFPSACPGPEGISGGESFDLTFSAPINQCTKLSFLGGLDPEAD